MSYDGKKEVKLTGTVVAARFGFPHSRYVIEVKNEKGEVDRWTLMTEDPKDAEKLGFADEIRAIKKGDPITVVGWPNRFKEKEIRGHQLHYPDGKIVMMRRGNYIWNKDLRRIRKVRLGTETLPDTIKALSTSLSPEEKILAMVEEGEMVDRIAFEIINNTAKLYGFDDFEGLLFPGVGELVSCHTQREDFIEILNFDNMSEKMAEKVYGNQGFIRNYNALLSRYWETDIESC